MIIDITKINVSIIETDHEGNSVYMRYDDGTWMQYIGESLEPAFFKQDQLEKEYQDYMKGK